jgi:hypothetical protein
VVVTLVTQVGPPAQLGLQRGGQFLEWPEQSRVNLRQITNLAIVVNHG